MKRRRFQQLLGFLGRGRSGRAETPDPGGEQSMTASALAPPRAGLLVADTWCELGQLCERVVAEVHDERTRVVVTTPLPIGRLQSPFSCSAQQLAQGVRRRAQVVGQLRCQGVAAIGVIGDPDPLLAVGDALGKFDEEALARTTVLVVTDGPDPVDWRQHRLTERLEAAYGVTVTRYLVDDSAAIQA